MPCTDCQNSPFQFSLPYSQNCAPDAGCTPVSAQCVYYGGPALSCAGVQTNDSLEVALQKMDTQLCQVLGDYSTYTYHCLPGPITTQAQFVSAVSSYACSMNDTLTTFTGTTFPAYQASINTRFLALEQPQITCLSAGVTTADSLQTILNKYCTKFSQLDSTLSFSGINWAQCFTVPTAPTTLSGALALLSSEICQIKGNGTVLPTFNNLNSCLSLQGTADSLQATLEAVKQKLCLTPTLDNNTLSSSCVSIPFGDQDLQTLLQNILSRLDGLSHQMPTFDTNDFTVSGTDCTGKTISLIGGAAQDKKVGATPTDTAPGSLQDKLRAGSGIGLDYTDPTKVTISTSGVFDTYRVKASTGDDSPDFLDQKVAVGSQTNGATLGIVYNATTKKLTLSPGIDIGSLFTLLMDYIQEDTDAKALFCQVVASCPSPCAPPTNVQAVAISSSSTTTTTTTLP
jgi:hypothetical protein